MLHLHIYEVAAYDTLDQVGGTASGQIGSPVSVSTAGATSVAHEFLIAVFLDIGHGSGTWTGGPGFESAQTTDSGAGGKIMFSECFQVASAGVQTATATYSGSSLVTPALIATFRARSSGSFSCPVRC